MAIIKVVFVGDSRVGKTRFLHRSLNGEDRSEYVPTVFDNFEYQNVVEEKGISFKIQLWDNAGKGICINFFILIVLL